MPNSHPTDELLMEHAAGATSEATGLLLATHLALCPSCRTRLQDFEAIGGALLEALEPAHVAARGLDAVLARLDAAPLDDGAPAIAAAPPRPAAMPAGVDAARIPQPLRGYLEASGEWRRVAPGMEQLELPLSRPGVRTRLLRIKAGAAMPRHTHTGSELTLVLEGGFHDEGGDYRRGDLAMADADTVHRPVAGAGADCLCLVVVEGGIRLTGPFGRMVNLMLRD